MFVTVWLNNLSKLQRKSPGKASAITILFGMGVFMLACAGSSSGTKSVAPVPPVAPAALTITSSAPTAANEGDVYTYAIVANDAAAKFSLISGPSSASISGSTLTWTPTHLQSRVVNDFEVQATNGVPVAISQKFSVTPTGTIRGTAVNAYAAAEGSGSDSDDLTKVYIGASIPNSGSWATVEGVAHSDGTFQIPGVPAGLYWFTTGSGGYWTSASDIDLGHNFLGRHDAVLSTKPASLALSLFGLKSWETTDSLELYNANLGQDFDWSDNLNPQDKSTVSQWSWTGPLSDASRGDSWYVSQVSTEEVGDTSWHYLVKATPGITITQTDGSVTDFPGALGDPTQMTVHMKTMGSQFAGLAPAIGLNAEVHSTTLGVYSQPFTTSSGMIGDAPTLLEINGQDPITQDVDFGDLTFGNPFPTNWTPFVSLEYEFTVPFTASGASTPADVPAEIYVSTTQLPTIDKPLAPVITPVRNVKLNGSAFTQKTGLATLNPSLSWDDPETGPATNYRVSVYQLTKTGMISKAVPLLDLFTHANSLAMPDGVLAGGNEYFFAIRSYLTPSVDLTIAPYRDGFPWAHIDMLTSVASTTGVTASVSKLNKAAHQHIVRSAIDPGSLRPGSIRRPGLSNMRQANPITQ